MAAPSTVQLSLLTAPLVAGVAGADVVDEAGAGVVDEAGAGADAPG